MFSPTFEFIDMTMTVCDPADAQTIQGLKCSANASNEISAAGGITVYLGFSNNYIDPTNYTSPNQTFIDFMEWTLHPAQTRKANIYVDMETIEDYDSYLFTDKSSKREFYSISGDKMREEQLTQRNYLLQTLVQRGKLNRMTSRNYVNLVNIMSNVGGLSEPLFLIGSILALGYARYKYMMIISNELYEFEQNKKIKASKKVAPHPNINKKVDLKGHLTSLKSTKKLEYSGFNYFAGLFSRKNSAEQLAQKARKKVIKDLDISKIIHKLKEIDKLKMLLLNKNQLEAFKFIKKPRISLREERSSSKGGLKSLILCDNANSKPKGGDVIILQSQHKPSKYESLYLAYKQMKSEKNTQEIIFNQRLLNILDEDIIKVFVQMETYNISISDVQNFEQMLREINDKSINLNLGE